MQPIRLHWAPYLRGPRAIVVEQVAHFFAKYYLCKGFVERLINLIVSK